MRLSGIARAHWEALVDKHRLLSGLEIHEAFSEHWKANTAP